MIVELTVKDLAERLEVKEKTIRMYDFNGTLNDKLLKIDGKMIDKRKIGRKTLYSIEVLERDTNKSICAKYNVKNGEKLKQHTYNRKLQIEGELEYCSKKDMGDKIDSDKRTIGRYDDILILEQFMKKEDYVYFRYENGNKTQVSEDEYKNFWRVNFIFQSALEGIRIQFAKGILTPRNYESLYEDLKSIYCKDGVIYHKMDRYINGVRYDEFLDIINDTSISSVHHNI